jgi:valine--pyruvate aminotransferase
VVRPYYRERAERALALAHEHLPADVPWRVHESEGAFFLWFWFQDLPITCRELYRRLKAAGLLIVPGKAFFFGLDTEGWPHAEQCIRVSFTQPEEMVAEGFEILGRVITEIYR